MYAGAYKEVIVGFSGSLLAGRFHAGSLELHRLGVFTPQELARVSSQQPLQNQLLRIHQHTLGL